LRGDKFLQNFKGAANNKSVRGLCYNKKVGVEQIFITEQRVTKLPTPRSRRQHLAELGWGPRETKKEKKRN